MYLFTLCYHERKVAKNTEEDISNSTQVLIQVVIELLKLLPVTQHIRLHYDEKNKWKARTVGPPYLWVSHSQSTAPSTVVWNHEWGTHGYRRPTKGMEPFWILIFGSFGTNLLWIWRDCSKSHQSRANAL